MPTISTYDDASTYDHDESTYDYDVIIVGAGPTGLGVANELTLTGNKVLLIDKLSEGSSQSKGLNIQPRTGELFDLRGLYPRAEELSTTTTFDGHFAGISLDYQPFASRHNFQLVIPQPQTETVLRERFEQLGGSIQWNTEVVNITSDPQSITVTLATGEELTARYLVATDGGRSFVRKHLQLPFPGIDGIGVGTVADLELGGKIERLTQPINSVTELLKSIGPKNTDPKLEASIFSIGIGNKFRLVKIDEDGDKTVPVERKELDDIIFAQFGADIWIEKVAHATRFGNGTRVLDNYVHDRIIFGGDAAHVHLPSGGQGLNLGYQDAMNLGWKLSLVLAGHQPASFLQNYSLERRAHAVSVLENVRAQEVLLSSDQRSQAMRSIFTELLENPQANFIIAGKISSLSWRYDYGHGDHPLLGTRFIDKPYGNGWYSDLFHKGQGVLLTNDHALAELAAPWAPRVHCEIDRELSESWLVRPDGYIAWTTDAGIALTDSLSLWFGK